MPLARDLAILNGLHFRVGNQRKHQFEARKLAVTYAREKAEHLTELSRCVTYGKRHEQPSVARGLGFGGCFFHP